MHDNGLDNAIILSTGTNADFLRNKKKPNEFLRSLCNSSRMKFVIVIAFIFIGSTLGDSLRTHALINR